MLFTIDIQYKFPRQETPKAKANENEYENDDREICRQLDRMSLTRLTYTYIYVHIHTYAYIYICMYGFMN